MKMLGNSLRNLRPATVEERKANQEKAVQVLAGYKQASKEIHEICTAKGLVEPVVIA